MQPHPAPPVFAAVDWGTTSFRLRLVDARGEVVGERRSEQGMRALARDGYADVLAAHLAALGAPALPVAVCGMAGSREGWHEAPYVDVPASPGEILDHAVRVPAAALDVRILPGLAVRDPDRPDVMRGEETKLLGFLAGEGEADGLVCMPGTHTKWVRLAGGRVAGFATVMTGELFALLCEQSILRHAVAGQEGTGRPDAPDFLAGLARGLADPGGAVAALFALRARGLLLGAGGGETADRLSGLLIGAEVGGQLADGAARRVTLVASGRLAGLYARAIEAAGAEVRAIEADRAVLDGLTLAARRFWPEAFERRSA
ncbi:2-dehydro-3-deoxygalactonokinase [Arenibaculum sp.]|uniref:2-dehydro-3-deoxygalactonokinase n=1 Tax=Arenibaculum sp. TaxID=2865862 RepID=UPI002E0E39A1|nr:2-dehydro-3-deoxygalactonokinase [Arenibaculum sp.]